MFAGARRLVLIQLAAFGCLGALFALLGLQRFFVAPLGSTAATVTVFVVQTLPLLVLAGALAKPTLTGAFWCAMVSLLYLLHGILQVFSVDGRRFGGSEIVLALALFTLAFALSFHLRGQSDPRRGESAQSGDDRKRK